MRSWLLGRVALLVLLLAPPASADRVQEADKLFREGRALLKAEQYPEACEKLERSQQLDPGAGTAINLGDCFEKLGKVASALLAYQAARGLLQPGDPRIGPVELQIQAISERVPRLTLKLKVGAPTGTHVRRDGRKVPASQLGVAVPVNPGKHVVLVSAPDHEEKRLVFSLKAGDVRELQLEPGVGSSELDVSPPPRLSREEARDEHESGSSSQATWGWVVGGAGALLLGTGAYFGLSANSTEDAAKAAGCTATRCPTTHAQGLSDDADSERSTANVFAGLGVLALGGAAVLVLTSPPGDQGAARFRIAPRVLVGGSAAQIEGVW